MKKWMIIGLSSLLFVSMTFWGYAEPTLSTPVNPDTIDDEREQWSEFLQNSEIILHEDFVEIKKETVFPLTRSASAVDAQAVQSETVGIFSLSDEYPVEEIYADVRAGRQGHYAETVDSSLYCTVFTNILYTAETYGSANTFYCIDSITGGFIGSGCGSYIASGVSVTFQSIEFGQCGFTYSDGYRSFTGEDRFSPSIRNWTSSYDFSSWIPVKSAPSAAMGCTLTVSLKRGSSSWDVELENYAFGG